MRLLVLIFRSQSPQKSPFDRAIIGRVGRSGEIHRLNIAELKWSFKCREVKEGVSDDIETLNILFFVPWQQPWRVPALQ